MAKCRPEVSQPIFHISNIVNGHDNALATGWEARELGNKSKSRRRKSRLIISLQQYTLLHKLPLIMATSNKPTIAIIGGGISGLTLAIALIRRGLNVRIYEQAHAFGKPSLCHTTLTDD